MYSLDLPEESAIHLIISGIGNRSLREIAVSLKSETVDNFLEEMQQITSVSTKLLGKAATDAKPTRAKGLSEKIQEKHLPQADQRQLNILQLLQDSGPQQAQMLPAEEEEASGVRGGNIDNGAYGDSGPGDRRRGVFRRRTSGSACLT